jgi:hypothetical protein
MQEHKFLECSTYAVEFPFSFIGRMTTGGRRDLQPKGATAHIHKGWISEKGNGKSCGQIRIGLEPEAFYTEDLQQSQFTESNNGVILYSYMLQKICVLSTKNYKHTYLITLQCYNFQMINMNYDIYLDYTHYMYVGKVVGLVRRWKHTRNIGQKTNTDGCIPRKSRIIF